MNTGNNNNVVTTSWRQSIVPRFRALGATAVQETGVIVHNLVHTIQQPISGLVRGGEYVIQETKMAMNMGTAMIHVAVGVLAGYAAWEITRVLAPRFSAQISDAVTRPFKRPRRVALDRSNFY